jgi:PAN domain
MGKTKQMAAWLAVVGLALAVQGCWGDKQDQLTLLGNGGCRTAEGGDGHPKYVAGLSLDACKARCFDGATPCTAIEYNANNSNCEIHAQRITRFQEVAGVACYVVKE